MKKLGSNRLGRQALIPVGVGWGIAVVVGLVLLFIYQTAPGANGNPSQHWPAGSRIVPAANQVHLVMVAHPRCPCTRASIEALARIMAQCRERATASVLFWKPKRAVAGW